MFTVYVIIQCWAWREGEEWLHGIVSYVDMRMGLDLPLLIKSQPILIGPSG